MSGADESGARPTVLRDKAAMRAWSRAERAAGRRVALVPTMGALHEGHLSLVRAAAERADTVVVSIYVNPTQFAPGEDFAVYPRDLGGDLHALEALGVDAVFAPADLYARTAPAHETWITVEDLQAPLCGASRPGFFRGVATVVAKLFHIVEPDVAVFGLKDYQQHLLVSRMVRDLDFATEIVAMPIVRESDGLAMSSRNRRLSEDQRIAARAVPGSLSLAEALIAQGERDPSAVRRRMRARIEDAGGAVDYIALVDAETLAERDRLDGRSLVAIAAWFGDVRLIDNRVVAPRESGPR